MVVHHQEAMMKAQFRQLIYVLLLLHAFPVLAATNNEKNTATFFRCEQVIPDRQESYKKIKEQQPVESEKQIISSERRDPKLPEDYPTCNVYIENVCGQYDTGKRCKKAPCPGVHRYVDYKTSCEACRHLNLYGIFDRRCEEIEIEK